MGRIICVTGIFDVYKDGIPTGEKEFVVSHGVCEATGRGVVLQSEHPAKLGAKFDKTLGAWVIEQPKEK